MTRSPALPLRSWPNGRSQAGCPAWDGSAARAEAGCKRDARDRAQQPVGNLTSQAASTGPKKII